LSAGSVSFAVKAFNSTRSITINQQTVTINTAEIKIDVTISNFPFKFKMTSWRRSEHAKQLQPLQLGRATEVTMWTPPVQKPHCSEHEFHPTTDQEQNVEFSSGTLTSSTNTGFFKFVKTATVTSPTGVVSTVTLLQLTRESLTRTLESQRTSSNST